MSIQLADRMETVIELVFALAAILFMFLFAVATTLIWKLVFVSVVLLMIVAAVAALE